MKLGERETTFWEALQQFPPYRVRLLAKNGAVALSDADVAIASGLDINRVRQIKFMKSWDAVTVGELLRFTAACGFDPTRNKDRRRAYDYERSCQRNKNPYKYLRQSPKWASEFLPLFQLLKEELTRQSSAA